MRKMDPLRIVGIIFAAVGIIFALVGGFIQADFEKFKKNGVKTDAYIEFIDYSKVSSNSSNSSSRTNSTTYVYYTYEGKNYDHVDLHYYSSSMHMGQKIEIYVNPDDPYDIRSVSAAGFFGWIFVGFGSVFAILGFVFIAIGKTKPANNGGAVAYNNGQQMQAYGQDGSQLNNQYYNNAQGYNQGSNYGGISKDNL